MKVEIRHDIKGGKKVPGGLVLICQDQEESEMVDAVMGNKVGHDGLISTSTVECRVADGFCEHYLYVKKAVE